METAEKQLWEEFYKEANDFCKAAYNAFEKKKFTNDTLYNIICMAIEKFLVSFLVFKGEMPANHTLSGLIEEIKLQFPVTKEMTESIYFIDRFQDICIIDPVERKEPNEQEMQKMVLAMVDIKEWVGTFVL